MLTSKVSPNGSKIVIVIIMVVGEAELAVHSDGIIAQTLYFARAPVAGDQRSNRARKRRAGRRSRQEPSGTGWTR